MHKPYPLLTVVVPVRNEAKYIEQTLGFLLAQDYPADRLEILVGVADSTDRTAEVVKRISEQDSRVRCFHNPYALSSGARRLGAQAASGDIVIFVDGHVWIDNDQLFRNTVRLMEEKGVAILSRPQFLDTPENNFFQRAVALARKSRFGHGPASTIYTSEEKYVDPTSSGAAYRREVFERVGFFDTRFDACEDVEFNYRCAKAGFRSYTSKKLAVYYYPRSSFGALFRQMVRYGTGRYRFARRHPASLARDALFLSLVAGAIVAAALVIYDWRFTAGAAVALACCYILAAVCSSAAIALRHGWRYGTVLPAIFLAIHGGLVWGFVTGALRGPGTVADGNATAWKNAQVP